MESYLNAFLAQCVVLVLSLMISQVALSQNAIPGLYNTGVDDVGNPLEIGVKDPHYSVDGPGADSAFVLERLIQSDDNQWVAPPEGSGWIGTVPSSQSAPSGFFTYTLEFDLDGLDPSTAEITGDVASDNIVKIYINGVDINYTREGQYRELASFIVDTAFVSGVNTLGFEVWNVPTTGHNPSGLIVANMSGEAATRVNTEDGTVPSYSALQPNYPNPFRDRTTIEFELEKPSQVSLKVFDIRGFQIAVLTNEFAEIGLQRVQWNGRNSQGNEVGSGIYFYELRTIDRVETKSMLLIR